MDIIAEMNFNVADVKVADLRAACRAAKEAAYGAPRARPSGCGRAYVHLGYKSIRKNSKVVKVLAEEGFRMTPRPYCKGMHIYVGYDNCTGVEMGRAEAIAAAFRECGIPAGFDADGD